MIGSVNAVGTALLFIASALAVILIAMSTAGPIRIRMLWTVVAVASVLAIIGAGMAGYTP